MPERARHLAATVGGSWTVRANHRVAAYRTSGDCPDHSSTHGNYPSANEQVMLPRSTCLDRAARAAMDITVVDGRANIQ